MLHPDPHRMRMGCEIHYLIRFSFSLSLFLEQVKETNTKSTKTITTGFKLVMCNKSKQNSTENKTKRFWCSLRPNRFTVIISKWPIIPKKVATFRLLYFLMWNFLLQTNCFFLLDGMKLMCFFPFSTYKQLNCNISVKTSGKNRVRPFLKKFHRLLNISEFWRKARTHLLSIKTTISSNANNNSTQIYGYCNWYHSWQMWPVASR